MILHQIDTFNINKIFDNRDRKIEYLNRMAIITGTEFVTPRTNLAIDRCIMESWDYRISKDVIREMFFESEKFLNGIRCKEEIDYLIEDWDDNNLGVIKWPFSAMIFDSYVARLNRRNELTEEEKDNIISKDVIRFRRIKDINTKRNDYIESLIILHNENIIPTFKHNRGLDFYINGEPFDQKVSRSVGRAFEDEYGDNYYDVAINNPALVAKSLYENQDEERFDDDPRLYVVYLDNDITSEDIEQSIVETNFSSPIDIAFDYYHSNRNVLRHDTHCYILLLRK